MGPEDGSLPVCCGTIKPFPGIDHPFAANIATGVGRTSQLMLFQVLEMVVGQYEGSRETQ